MTSKTVMIFPCLTDWMISTSRVSCSAVLALEEYLARDSVERGKVEGIERGKENKESSESEKMKARTEGKRVVSTLRVSC